MNASPLPVAVLGATGLVGQRLIALLEGHPWFRVTEVAASVRREGLRYGESVDWKLAGRPPASVAALRLEPCSPERIHAQVVFSALDASVAGEIESAFAATGRAVVTNARNHRLEPDVPLVVPEVNAEHLGLLERQRARDGGGFIVTNPNCSTIGLALALAPLHREFGVRSVIVTTLQALSGAGYPGVSAFDVADNVVPGIPGEERKIERETGKILGTRVEDRVEPATIAISAQTHRVPVTDGHLLAMSLVFEAGPVRVDEAARVLREFRGEPQDRELPSAPTPPVIVLEGDDRPQPRLDRDAGGGMALSVGRLRSCPVGHLRLSALSHNTVRGAAGGTILIAELLAARGLLS